MSQPHPPIPEPQPHPGADEPRTQSILLPPSQRSTEEPPAEPVAEAPSTGQLPQQTPFVQSDTGPLPGTPTAVHPGYDPAGQVTGPVDFAPEHPADPNTPAGYPAPSGSAAPTDHDAPTGLGGLAGLGSPSGSSAVDAPHASHAGQAPSAGRRRSPLAAVRGRGGPALVSLGLGVLALVLLEIGLVRDFGNQSLWDVVPTWSTLATVATLLVLVPGVAALTGRLPLRTAWRVGAAGVAALAATWVLVALPLVASDRGFWLTTAVAAAGAALWLAPGRSE